MRGGAFLLLLCVFFFSINANAQDNCTVAPCNRLSIKVIKRKVNVTPSCSASGVCEDQFHQIAFDVYLRYRDNVPPIDPVGFDLDYSNLDVGLKLLGSPQFSRIDVDATEDCFTNGVGANWLAFTQNSTNSDGVKFTPTSNEVTISFANTIGNEPCGASGPGNATNTIRLTYGAPSMNADQCGSGSNICAYALLFTVVVNAYPGESVGLGFTHKKYVPKNPFSPASICGDITVGSPGNGFNGAIPVVVAPPKDFADTPNDQLFAKFVNLGNASFEIKLENIGADQHFVNYVEFVVVAELLNLDALPDFGSVGPTVVNGGINPITGAQTKYLHYIIYPPSGGQLNGGSSISLCTITIIPPVLQNVNWSANLSFLQAGSPNSPETKSRIGTSRDCTSLQLSPGGVNTSNPFGNDNCTNTSIVFKIEGTPYTCGLSKVRVGLRSTLPPANIRLSKVEFDLDFSWQGSGYTITDVHYPTWPAVACGDFGCFTIPPSQSRQCWTTTGAGKTFQYCFDTQGNAPVNFVLDDLNDIDNMEIIIATPLNGCVDNVTIRKLRIVLADGSFIPCIPVIDEITGFPLCAPASEMITGKAETELFQPVSDVAFTMKGANGAIIFGLPTCTDIVCTDPPCLATDMAGNDGLYQFQCSDCSGCNLMEIIPFKDDNPLNGVTTYDLVLISKHILGIEPLGSPYKMIAADANKSNSITTFDIVEIRKLILGIYQELPMNTSWRFVEKAYSFPVPFSFQSAFPEGINCISFPASNADFVGIKVGDVNNTAVSHSRPSDRQVTSISWPVMHQAKDDVVTLPIIYTGGSVLEAVQLGLRFDPTLLQLISPAQGDIPSYLAGNFNLLNPAQGEIRTLWLPMTGEAEKIQPNTVLFYLSFKVLGDLLESTVPLWLDNQLLDCAAWTADGTEFAFQQTNSGAKAMERNALHKNASFQVSVRPNPTTDEAMMLVLADKTETARLAIYDAFGRQLVFKEMQLHKGTQEIPLAEVAQFPDGVYQWKLYTRNFEQQGHLVKQ